MISKTLVDIMVRQFAEIDPDALRDEAARLLHGTAAAGDPDPFASHGGKVNEAMIAGALLLLLPQQTSLAEALMRLEERRGDAGCIVIDDPATSRPLGLLTEQEVRDLAGRQRPDIAQLKDVIAPLPAVAHPHMSLKDALRLMKEHRLRQLVIVDEDRRTLGLLTEDALLKCYLYEQQRITQALLDRERKYRTLLDALPVGVAITDPDGRLLEINRAFARLFDLPGDCIPGEIDLTARAFVHPDGTPLPNVDQPGTRTLAAGCSIENMKMGLRREDGTTVWLNVSATPIPLKHYGVAIVYDDITDVTLLKESQQRLEHLVQFDPLTNLPNRILLGDRLQQALAITRRGGSLLAVCCLNLDNFKPINDTYGNDVGDLLLKAVAERIKNALRGGDTVARLGGDEFVLLLGEIENSGELEQTLSRFLKIIAVPYKIGDIDLQVSASAGVTIAPTDSSDPDALLRHANQAMLAAKQAGTTGYHLFDVMEERRARTTRENQMRIRLALTNREFLLYYQPKVNMRTGKVTGLEALIRWQHPERGLLAPGDFLPMIEGHECMIAVGEWVTEEALRQVCTWALSGLELPVSVNIAAHHLMHPDFVPRLAGILAATKNDFPALNPAWLELEILETAALEDMGHVSQIIEACMNLGVGFALDDFGTGYSSLTYLKKLQANTLKIDQSFVRDMLDDTDDLAIVEGVVGLTTAFGRKVIAEGVETVQHGMMLMHLGCDLAQGYGIARPMPAAAVPGWVAAFLPSPVWLESLEYSWSREDFPLLSVVLDHQHWVESLLDSLRNSSQPQFDESFFDPANCRFGNWYNTHGAIKFGHIGEFNAICRLHDHAYRIGAQIARLHSDNQQHLAKDLMSQLHAANEDLYQSLNRLRREIADQDMLPPTNWAHIRSN